MSVPKQTDTLNDNKTPVDQPAEGERTSEKNSGLLPSSDEEGEKEDPSNDKKNKKPEELTPLQAFLTLQDDKDSLVSTLPKDIIRTIIPIASTNKLDRYIFLDDSKKNWLGKLFENNPTFYNDVDKEIIKLFREQNSYFTNTFFEKVAAEDLKDNNFAETIANFLYDNFILFDFKNKINEHLYNAVIKRTSGEIETCHPICLTTLNCELIENNQLDLYSRRSVLPYDISLFTEEYECRLDGGLSKFVTYTKNVDLRFIDSDDQFKIAGKLTKDQFIRSLCQLIEKSL